MLTPDVPEPSYLKFFKLFLVAGLMLVIASCNKSEKNIGPLETIRIGAFKGEFAALVWLAESEGFFAKYGLSAKVTGYESGVAAVDGFMEGKEDIATAADSVFVRKSLSLGSNDNLRILAVIAKAESIEILARTDRGISKPSDLKGKRIALTSKAPSDYFLDRFLLYNHIDPQAVTVVDLPPLKVNEAIAQGSVDAAITWEPYVWEIKQKLAGKALSWPAQSDQAFYFLLICNSDFAEKRPEAAKKLLQALNDAETLLRKDPARARQALTRRLVLDERYLAAVWLKNSIGLSLDQSLLVALEDHTRWAITKGFAPKGQQFNYLKNIFSKPLISVRPDAVVLY